LNRIMVNNSKRTETPLIETKNFKGQYGVTETFIKDESKNPFGTIKDRRNWHILQEANRLKVDKLVLITSGNNGYSLAQLAKGSSIKVVCIINKDISQEMKVLLSSVAYQVIEVNLDYKILRPEEIVAFAREKDDEVIWDVTNGYEEYYSLAVDEILKTIKPDYIVVPVGSGGIYLGFVQALENRKSSAKVIGIGVQNTVNSFADKLSTPWTPYARALEHYNKLGHSIYRLTEDEVKKTHQIFKNMLDCEPSSSIVFAALQKNKFRPKDVIVFLNSGKNIIGK